MAGLRPHLEVRRGKVRGNNTHLPRTDTRRSCLTRRCTAHEKFSTFIRVVPVSSANPHERIAVVTGASSGIGEATATTLAALGFHVVAVARRADRIEALANKIGGTPVVADVTDDEAVAALARGLGRVDVLVNNAGGARGLEPVADADLE